MMLKSHLQPLSCKRLSHGRLPIGNIISLNRKTSLAKPSTAPSQLDPLRTSQFRIGSHGLALRSSPVRAAGTSGGCADSGPRRLRVHFVRKDRNTRGWGLHTWGDVTYHPEWQKPIAPSGYDEDGSSYWDVEVRPQAARVGLLVYQGEQKAAWAEVELLNHMKDVWVVGDHQFFTSRPDMADVPAGTLTRQCAIWANTNTIVWRHALSDMEGTRTFKLHYSSKASMSITGSGVQRAEEVYELRAVSPDVPADVAARYPHLRGCAALQLPEEAVKKAHHLLKGQLLVSMHTATGAALDATGLQLQGALDDLCMYNGPLGYYSATPGQEAASGSSSFGAGGVTVWAPTAQRMELLRWQGPRGGEPEVHVMREGQYGEWSLDVPPGWYGSYYKYRVTVYCPFTQRVEVSEATDPYARSLAADGERTQFLHIWDPALAPPGWSSHPSPPLSQWTDISIYELHVRDFSATDESVPPALRGKYLAFCPDKVGGSGSAGLRHLATLREVGVNHLHLLPTYDFGSVPERPEEQRRVEDDLSSYPPDSEVQQAAVLAVADQDAFNWGYDPVHYGVPEGSYATNPDGPSRILEYRQMVQALHAQGWRVVPDVVYNHTFRAGPHDRYSVLDKIVPGYYHRRLENGEVCQSTCCNNTATEHAMCERLVVDDIIHWAQNYRVDGFRFDIMGHLMLSTLMKMRAGLDALTLEKDGVDGKSIYIYGEAWDFGEVLNNARGKNCGQMNLAGTKLGAFNDRLRDGALGGGPFEPHDFQGLVTGLALAPNPTAAASQAGGSPGRQLEELLLLSDWVRYSLAGNLRDYPLQNADGVVRRGEDATAHGQPLAYGAEPCEHVAFIGCHDNLTIWDYVSEKAPPTSYAPDRARMSVMCLSLVALSQGVPFFHAGDDLLRSKSLDRDSYNSGDHFNRLDWTGATNNFGVGLPVATKNQYGWGYKRPLLANPFLKPSPDTIRLAADMFKLLVRIRYSSPLFRLARTADVVRQLTFFNTGPDQVPGVVAMTLTSADQLPPAGSGAPGSGVLDPGFKRVVVVFNASPLDQELGYPAGPASLQLHPLQAAFTQDPRTSSGCVADNGQRVLRLPPRTTGVFVERR